MTKVVHCKQGIKYDVYIGRPSKWGNPFSHLDKSIAEFKVKDRQEAIGKYSEWILKQPELISSLWELENKVLGCWCKPKSCHGDTLAELANNRLNEVEKIIRHCCDCQSLTPFFYSPYLKDPLVQHFIMMAPDEKGLSLMKAFNEAMIKDPLTWINAIKYKDSLK